jgi:hypothetical protein
MIKVRIKALNQTRVVAKTWTEIIIKTVTKVATTEKI